MKDVEITVCKEDDIESLCNFEKEARETEKDIWGWESDGEAQQFYHRQKELSIAKEEVARKFLI